MHIIVRHNYHEILTWTLAVQVNTQTVRFVFVFLRINCTVPPYGTIIRIRKDVRAHGTVRLFVMWPVGVSWGCADVGCPAVACGLWPAAY